jgi:hypothetical protein
MSSIELTVVLVAVVLAGVGMIFALAALVLWLFAGHGGGWRRLAQRFAAHRTPDGQRFVRQTVQVGTVVFKRCVTVIVSPSGLHLDAGAVARAFGNAPLLIPWSEIRDEQRVRLHWQTAVRLSIGEPEIGVITLKSDLFQKVAPMLPSRRDAQPAEFAAEVVQLS